MFLEDGSGTIDAPVLRDAIARELRRPILTARDEDATDSTEILLIQIDPALEARVLYVEKAGRKRSLRRTITLPASEEQANEVIALLAGNLARNEAQELTASLARNEAREPTAQPPPLHLLSAPPLPPTIELTEERALAETAKPRRWDLHAAAGGGISARTGLLLFQAGFSRQWTRFAAGVDFQYGFASSRWRVAGAPWSMSDNHRLALTASGRIGKSWGRFGLELGAGLGAVYLSRTRYYLSGACASPTAYPCNGVIGTDGITGIQARPGFAALVRLMPAATWKLDSSELVLQPEISMPTAQAEDFLFSASLLVRGWVL